MFYEFDQLTKLMDRSEARLEILARQGLASGKEAYYRRMAVNHYQQVDVALRNGNGHLPMALAGFYLMLAENERGRASDG